jgi:RNA polymerase sigma-70 factor, ECF subfamily
VRRFAGVADEAVLAVYADTDQPAALREQAFHELAGRYQHRLFAICVRVLGSPADAEDAVQETLVRLARNAAGFRGESQLSTWLYRVARNVCTDHVRYAARRPATPVEDVGELPEAGVADDLVAAHDTAREIQGALAQLDERSRTLLLLVGVDGLSYAEAAEVVGVAVGTAKSRVSRARAELGRLLAAADDRDAGDGGPPGGRSRGEVAGPRPDATGRRDARGPPPA